MNCIGPALWAKNIRYPWHRYASPSVSDVLGYTPEEFIQTPLDQIVEPSHSEWLKKLTAGRFDEFQQNPKNNIFYVDEIPLIAKNGSTVWVEATYWLIINDDTGELEIVGVSRVITEKRLWKCKARKNVYGW
jgi:PAS domain S-box-containing protein